MNINFRAWKKKNAVIVILVIGLVIFLGVQHLGDDKTKKTEPKIEEQKEKIDNSNIADSGDGQSSKVNNKNLKISPKEDIKSTFSKYWEKVIVYTSNTEKLIKIILMISSPFLFLYLIKMMAERDLILSNVKEGTGKAIVGAGDKFFRFIFEYKNHVLLATQKEVDDFYEICMENYLRQKANFNAELQKIKTDFSDDEEAKKLNIDKLSKPIRPKKREVYDIVKIPNELISTYQKSNKLGTFIDWIGLGGIKYLGLPGLHKIHKYRFRWNSLRQNNGENIQDSGGGIYFKSHEEDLRYFLLQSDVYYGKLEKAEDRRMLQLDVDFTIAVRIKNPYLALFGVQEWLEYVWGQIIPAVRRAIRHHYDWIEEVEIDEKGNVAADDDKKEKARKIVERKVWDSLVGSKYSGGQDDDDDDGKPEREMSIIERLRYYYGVKIDDFTMLRVDITGEKKEEFIQMATQVIRSLQEARKKRIDYQVEVERLNEVYGKIKEFGDTGELIRRLEALEKASEKGTVFVSAPEFTKLAESASKKLSNFKGGSQ